MTVETSAERAEAVFDAMTKLAEQFDLCVVRATTMRALKLLIDGKWRFIDEQRGDDHDDEPACGYAQFDETVTDWCRDIAELAEQLFPFPAEGED